MKNSIIELSCFICGKNHRTEICDLVRNATNIKDKPTLTKARLTLPDGLEIKDRCDGSTIVTANETFKTGILFGPLIARVSNTLNPDIDFPLKLFDEIVAEGAEETEDNYLQTDDEDLCNWMCLVSCATYAEEQNLICFQMRRKIYFLVIKEVIPGDQLKVWYAAQYAAQMSAKLLPCDGGHTNMDNHFMDQSSSFIGTDHEYINNSKKKKMIKSRKNIEGGKVAPTSIQLDKGVSENLPPLLLGARGSQEEWTCNKCDFKETNLSHYAKHLMTHLKDAMKISGGNSKTFCSDCQADFKTRMILLKHRKECAKKKVASNPEINSNSNIPESSRENKKSPLENADLENVISSTTVTESLAEDLQSKKETEGQGSSMSCNKEDSFELFNFDSLHMIGPDNFNCGTSLDLGRKDEDVQKKSQTNEMDTDNQTQVETLAFNTASHPILDLSDEIMFQNIKHFPEIDGNIDKVLNKEPCLDYLQSNVIPRPKCDNRNVIDPMDFLVLECDEHLEVTDEDKNRLVENLLRDTEGRLNVYDQDVNSDTSELMKEMLIEDNHSVNFGPPPVENCDIINDTNENIEVMEQNEPTDSVENKKKANVFQCDICKKKFSTSKYLHRHLRKHTGEFTCMYCVAVFARKESLIKHVCSAEDRMKKLQKKCCKECRQAFATNQELKAHQIIHKRIKENNPKKTAEPDICNSSSLICSTCGKNFFALSTFQVHLCKGKNRGGNGGEKNDEDEDTTDEELEGRAERKLVCEICGVVRKSKRGLGLHLAKHGDRQFTCFICEKKFHRKDILSLHMKTHQDAQVSCPICKIKFRTTKIMKRHLEVHTGTKNFHCDQCDKSFYQKGNLVRHLKYHELGKNKLQCLECNKQFSTQESLALHQITHSEGRTFSCNFCPSEFVKAYLLNKHIRHCHTVDGYTCSYCQSDIKYLQSLKRHLKRIHPEKKDEWSQPNILEKMGKKRSDNEVPVDTSINQQTQLVNVGKPDQPQNMADQIEDKTNDVDTPVATDIVTPDLNSATDVITTESTTDVTTTESTTDVTTDNTISIPVDTTSMINLSSVDSNATPTIRLLQSVSVQELLQQIRYNNAGPACVTYVEDKNLLCYTYVQPEVDDSEEQLLLL